MPDVRYHPIPGTSSQLPATLHATYLPSTQTSTLLYSPKKW